MGALFSVDSSGTDGLVGSQVPDFDLLPVDGGEKTTMRELLAAQKKPVLLDIYAEWCAWAPPPRAAP